MSDASVSSECSEVMILDDSAITVIRRAGDEVDDAHHINKMKGRSSNSRGGVNTRNYHVSVNNNHSNNDDAELPSLANLVAATVRDRVVLEQMEEIRALKAQLSASHRVEITGPNGTPVYARGSFSNGDFNPVSLQSVESDEDSTDDQGLFWDVGLEMAESGGGANDGTVPLNKLANIEIRIGGIMYVTTAEVEGTSMAFGIRPGNKFDLHQGEPDMTRSAVAEFNTEEAGVVGGRSALLTFHVRDFPRPHWRSLQSVAMLNRSIALRQQEREEQREEMREIRQMERSELIERGEMDPEDEDSDYESDYDEDDDQEPLDVYNYLTLCLSKRHPGQRADVTSVSFCVKSVRGRIESLNNRGEGFQHTKEKVFRKIDELYREEIGGMESLQEALAATDDA